MEGQRKGGSTTKVTIDDGEGNVTELTSNIEIDRAIVTGNEKFGHKIEGGNQLLIPDYIRCLGYNGEGPSTSSVLRGTFTFSLNTTDATRDFITVCKYNLEVATVIHNDDILIQYNNTKKL